MRVALWCDLMGVVALERVGWGDIKFWDQGSGDGCMLAKRMIQLCKANSTGLFMTGNYFIKNKFIFIKKILY